MQPNPAAQQSGDGSAIETINALYSHNICCEHIYERFEQSIIIYSTPMAERFHE
jgi:hypothetical protein